MKKLLNSFLSFFNLMIIKNKISGVVDKRSLLAFQKTNKNYILYFEGLNKSENIQSDNFWKQSRYLDLLNLVDITLRKKIDGHFAEAGCWKGHSTYMISKKIDQYLKINQHKKIEFHIFDSFEGLSDIKDEDTNVKKLEKNKINHIQKQFKSDEKFVNEKVLKDFEFTRTYKGWIPTKFNKVEKLKFSFVHIDVDLYEPTLKSLEFFFPKLVSGGVIVCDDYNSLEFNGAKKAWNKFFLDNKVSINFAPSLGSSFIIK
tara:strand:- start:902 stop:1675 length:774 start_codon:yes stop_codon:yes gene_type:complete